MCSSLNHRCMHRFGSASETVASCAGAALSSQCQYCVGEIRRKCVVGRERTSSHPQTVKQTIRRLSNRLTLFSAAQQSARNCQGDVVGNHSGNHSCDSTYNLAGFLADLCVPSLGSNDLIRTGARTLRAFPAVIMQVPYTLYHFKTTPDREAMMYSTRRCTLM